MMTLNLDLVERPTSDYFGVGRGLMTSENSSLFFCRADSYVKTLWSWLHDDRLGQSLAQRRA
jgi:hypothetical protein